MARWTAPCAVAALLALMVLETSGEARRNGSYEDMAAAAEEDAATSLDEVIEQAAAVAATCQMENEFEAKDCRKQKRAAQSALNGALFVVPVDDDALVLGKYDFRQKSFPASLRGELSSKEVQSPEGEKEDPNDEECPEVSATLTPPPDRFVVGTQGEFAWKGVLIIRDEELARELREHPSTIYGEAIYRTAGIQQRQVQDRNAALKKRMALERLSHYTSNGNPMIRQRALEKRRCWQRGRTTSRQTLVKVQFVGLRLWVEDDRVPEYLISIPPSRVRLSVRRKQEAAKAAVAKQQAKPPQTANEDKGDTANHQTVEAAVPKAGLAPVQGWEGVRFGASVAQCRDRFRSLTEVQRLPFHDPTPSSNVRTYEVRAPAEDVKGMFLRFYKDRLYYIAVVFEYTRLGAESPEAMITKIAPRLGSPTSVKKVTQPGRRGPVTQVHWLMGNVEAQMNFGPTNYAETGFANLHLIENSIEKDLIAEQGAKATD